jgi:hypothetical protein
MERKEIKEIMNVFWKLAIEGTKTSRSNLSLQPVEYLILHCFPYLTIYQDSRQHSNRKLLIYHQVKKRHHLLHFIYKENTIFSYIKRILYFHVTARCLPSLTVYLLMPRVNISTVACDPFTVCIRACTSSSLQHPPLLKHIAHKVWVSLL